MFANKQYHQIIRKAVIAFGTLFNEVLLTRRDKNENIIETLKVPLSYAPKNKYMVRQTQDASLDKQVGVVYPRLSFYITGLNYDSRRKLPTIQRNQIQSDIETRKIQYNPVPYMLDFDLYIIGKNEDDLFQLVENIAPYFTPKYTVTINSIPELELKDDLDVTLMDSKFTDPDDGTFNNLRTICWTMSFTVPINLYPRITEQKLIRKVQIDLLTPRRGTEITPEIQAETPRSARIVIEPDPLDAQPTDDYGFSTSITEYDDGLKYDPVTDEDVEINNGDDD